MQLLELKNFTKMQSFKMALSLTILLKNDYHSKSINMPEDATIFGMKIKVDVS